MPHSQPTELRARPRGQTYHRQTRLTQLDKHPSLSLSHRPSPGGSPPTRSPLHSCTLARGRHQAGPRSQTRYYHVITTQLGTRPNLPLLYGPSSGGPACRLRVHCPAAPGPAPAIVPGQGDDTVLPNNNDSARHSPKLAAPLRTKFQGQPADSESSARLYRHVRGVTTDTCHGRHNGQQAKPTCAADLPTCRSSTDQVTARPPQIGNHSTGSVTSPACRSRRTRPPTASSTDTED